MNNVELEKKILEIISEDNYFEMIMKAKEFEVEYKKSDFYKTTKKPLVEVIKECKIYYALQLKDLGTRIQQLINGLSLDKFNEALDQISSVFGQENAEIKEGLEIFKHMQD